jgi:hypothetical protein
MNKSQQSFREGLLKAEKSTPGEKYRKDLAGLRERRLTGPQRVTLVVLIVFCVAASVRMGGAALSATSNLVMLARIGLGVGALASLAWAVLLGVAAKRGVIPRKDPVVLNRILVMAVVVAVGVTTFVALAMPDRARGTQVLITETIFLVIAAGFFLQGLIEQAELRTREKLIEMEIQMQEVLPEPANDPNERVPHP